MGFLNQIEETVEKGREATEQVEEFAENTEEFLGQGRTGFESSPLETGENPQEFLDDRREEDEKEGFDRIPKK